MSPPHRPSDVTAPWFSITGKIHPPALLPPITRPPPPRLQLRPRDLLLAICGLPLAICLLAEPPVHPPLAVSQHCTPVVLTQPPPTAEPPRPTAQSQPTAPQPNVDRPAPVAPAKSTAPRKRRARDEFATTARSILRDRVRPVCAKLVAPGKTVRVKLFHNTRAGVVVGARRTGHGNDRVEGCALDQVQQAIEARTWKSKANRRFTYTLHGPARPSA